MLAIKNFQDLIFEFRGIKVMIDVDLAVFYETEIKRLKEQVKRNIDRFPEDFMFILNDEKKVELSTTSRRLAKISNIRMLIQWFLQNKGLPCFHLY